MLDTLETLVTRLAACPDVTALVRYGRRRVEDMSPGGDFDLFVIVAERPKGLESVHFRVGGVPVDLNVRTFDDLRSDAPLTPIDVHLASGEVLVDKTNRLSELLPSLAERWQALPAAAGPNDRAAARFFQTHPLDKVRGRIETEPLFCNFLLATDVFWLVRSYFTVRRLAYPGERHALEVIKKRDLEVHRLVERFYETPALSAKLAVVEELTERVLEPIGGAWQGSEIVSLGEEGHAEDLQPMGHAFLARLLGS